MHGQWHVNVWKGIDRVDGNLSVCVDGSAQQSAILGGANVEAQLHFGRGHAVIIIGWQVGREGKDASRGCGWGAQVALTSRERAPSTRMTASHGWRWSAASALRNLVKESMAEPLDCSRRRPRALTELGSWPRPRSAFASGACALRDLPIAARVACR